MYRAVIAGLVIALTACSARTPVKAPSTVLSPLPEVESRPYTLVAGDSLAIKFWGKAELDQEVTIRPDGMISLPFVDDVRAAGLTPADLDADLTERYSAELVRPEITVVVTGFSGRVVYVAGEVGQVGSVALVSNMTLSQAIHEAGGLRVEARPRQTLLVRTGPDGQRIARSIDLRPVLSGADLDADVVLQPADIVFVPRAKITNITRFIEEYIYKLLPIRPVATIQLTGRD